MREPLLLVEVAGLLAVVAVISLLPAEAAGAASACLFASCFSSSALRRMLLVHWLIYFDFGIPAGIVPASFSAL